jgi:hypothetical protein
VLPVVRTRLGAVAAQAQDLKFPIGEGAFNWQSYADYDAKRAPLRADYEAKIAPLRAAILAYIKKHIPDCAWNGKELDFRQTKTNMDKTGEQK